MNWIQLYIEIFLLYVECNLPCLMTSDKDYLGKGNIDRFDALYFHAFYVNTDDKGKTRLKSKIFSTEFQSQINLINVNGKLNYYPLYKLFPAGIAINFGIP